MGRHCDPLDPDATASSEPEPPPRRVLGPAARLRPGVPGEAEVLGWGLFTSFLATVLIAVLTRRWLETLGIAALGITATALLVFVARRQRRGPGPI
jgi:hypothetical protein